jgi:ribosomal protein RSM22 (predicted rRNA methylase)
MSLLPSAVRSRLLALGEGVKRADLALRSERISENYKNKRNSSASLLTPEDALAYAMARMPATYAATVKAIEAMVQATDSMAPASLLDVGCGPGTAALAALDAFSSLQRFTLMDRNGPFLSLAADLTGTIMGDRQTNVVSADITRQSVFPGADLVMASYVMVELDGSTAVALAQKLWSAAGQALLLVEPGTPDGFRRLQEIRTRLVADGASVAAPCTHDNTCPMSGGQWCRFMARVQRSRDHRMLKQAALSYEDEPYAYLALVRTPARKAAQPDPRYRIIGPQTSTKIGVSLPACGPEGLETLYASKREKEKHRHFRKLDWGDASGETTT